MILVVGANGRLGRRVAAGLRAQGCAVLASSRTAHRSESGVILDLSRPETFAAALRGVEQVFTAVHGMTQRRRGSIERIDIDGHRRLIDAAAEAGVKRFVYTSATGAVSDHAAPLWRAKAQIEAHLAATGLDYTILRPSAFMELYAHDLVGKAVLAGTTVRLLGDGRMRRNLVSVEDVAAIAIRALTGEDCSGRTLEIGGPDNVTDRDVADLYARLSGRPARISAMPASVASALAAVVAPFHAGVANILRLPAQLPSSEGLCFDASSMAARLGREPLSLEAFVRRQLDRPADAG